MHGGMKTYRGSPAAARNYVEAGRGRADDYYLTEGAGIAERFAVSPDTGVRRLEPLTGAAYESWVAGVDPDTGVPKGRLRHDEKAVRFVEVVVNGPKSWSLAAELHPDISEAYDAAQERAATQIIAWLAQHATTRVGPRGAQVQVPVQQLEAVTVRHHTSRAGDPHRHLHLQINARVFAAGRWRGLHTVGVRDSLDAINGIGHAAVMTDPQFRQALARNGLTVNPDSGEVTELAEFVGPFSARAAQIGRNIERYEADWRAAHPGHEPGPALRRGWDTRAWAEDRPDKIVPRDGAELTGRWVEELRALGYRDSHVRGRVDAAAVGELDRDRAVSEVLARLAARRSGWNAADIRGEVEQLLARRNIVTEPGVRSELAEDLTARALAECVPLLDRLEVPEHIRALSSRQVLEVEADLTARLAARANTTQTTVREGREDALEDGFEGLDGAQREVVAALSGDRRLVVVEGAAGAGKTTTLAAARTAIDAQGARLMVVTPTLKAANVAARQVGSRASSAAWLAYQHGFRWDEHGNWTRLAVGEIDPHTGLAHAGPRLDARLRAGDLLLVDEAGMLDQDTARALLIIADEHQARLTFLGDRHQLPAVGRGGVLDLAARWSDPAGCLTLDTVHRFTCTGPDGARVSVPDEQYAQLSLAMRTGEDPGAVFDALLARDQIRVHAGDPDRVAALADTAVQALDAGSPAAVVADTREQVTGLNAAIRERLIALGLVDDRRTVTTRAGERIGVGDLIATRRNNTELGFANRDTWTLTQLAADGQVTVTGQHGDRTLPASYVREHVELAYASTVHGAQGETIDSAHLLLGEHTSAASAYVAMTRGRHTNTAHLVADSTQDARELWLAAFGRDRADLGPAHAAQLAAQQASRYATGRPVEQVLVELRKEWDTEARCRERLDRAVPIRDQLSEIVVLRRDHSSQLAPLAAQYEEAKHAAADAAARAAHAAAAIAAQADHLRGRLQAQWDAQRDAARSQARIVLAGPGRLGLRLVAVNRATEQLARWSLSWQPILPDMPTSTRQIAYYANRYDNPASLHAAFERYAHEQAEQAHPDDGQLLAAVEATIREREHAWRQLHDTRRAHAAQLGRYGRLAHTENPGERIEQLDHDINHDRSHLATARARIAQLTAEPAIHSRPPEFLTTEHQSWKTDRDSEREAAQLIRAARAAAESEAAARERIRYTANQDRYQSPAPHHGPSIGR
jgi:hypothetical protein